MSDSIYAPPEAEIEISEAQAQEYYVVSPTKFYLLSVMTFDLYFVYWFYRNWRLIKARDRDTSWPPARGLFYIFFTHSLFTDVDEAIKTQNRQYQWNPMSIATLFVFLDITANILGRMAWNNVGSPMTDFAGVLLTLLLPAILLQGQRAINFACGDPEGKTNAGFSLANWIWLVVGCLWWLLTLFGLYAIVFEPALLME